MPETVFRDLTGHLLPRTTGDEQGCFVFARARRNNNGDIEFEFVDWIKLVGSDFEHQSEYHLELKDAARARVIKKAHDMGCSLIEFHSHPGPYPAQFSPSDFAGFSEFVPHVWWRLKNRPYAAVVVAKNDIDGLVWIDNPHTCIALHEITLETRRVSTTKLSDSCLKKTIWKD